MTELAVRTPTSAVTTAVRVVALVLLVVGLLSSLALTGQRASSLRLYADTGSRTQHVLVVGDRIVWRDGALRNRELPLAQLTGPGDDQLAGVRSAQDLRRYLGDKAIAREVPVWLTPRAFLIAGTLLCLLLLRFGPRPWRGNRWYWFWITGILGFGGIAYLVLSGANPRTRAEPAGEYLHGGIGLVRALGQGLFLSFLLLGLQQVLFPDLSDAGVVRPVGY